MKGLETAVYLFEFNRDGIINEKPASGSARGTPVLIKEADRWLMLVEQLGPKEGCLKAAIRIVCHTRQMAEAKTPQQMDVAGESLLYLESMVRILVDYQPATVTCHVADKVLC